MTPTPTYVEGADISTYQPSFNPAGLGFLFVKATEGRTWASSTHDAQVARARAAGVIVGHYHWAWPGNVEAQVAWFKRHAKVQPGDLIALDWENPQAKGLVSMRDKDALLKALQAEFPDNRVLLYTFTYYPPVVAAKGVGYVADGLWLADYRAATPTAFPWLVWQWTANPHDRNRAKFPSLEAMRAWASKHPATAPAEPAAPAEGDPAPGPVVVERIKLGGPVTVSAPVEVIAGGRVTTGFRVPGSWAAKVHTGEDWNGPGQDLGQPVHSPVAGRVVIAGRGGWGAAYGVHVVVQAADGTRTAMCHLSSASVRVGQDLKAGQIVGKVGNTGNSTGPHCHVERRASPFGYWQFIKPTYASVSSVWDGSSYPGDDTWGGSSHPAVTLLGRMLSAAGYASAYKVGPGPEFGPADKAATKAYQLAQGWTGDAADGIPGPTTWARLVAATTTKGA